MKKMKKVLVFLGMGSCVSEAVDHHNSSLVVVKFPPKIAPLVPLQLMGFEKTVSKDEVFFDSKAWLDSDDDEFHSVNGDYSPEHKHNQINNGDDEQMKNNGAEDDKGGKLSDLLRKNNSFNSDSQTSVKATKIREDEETTPKTPSGKTRKRFLPTLLTIISCGSHKKKNKNKKRLSSPTQISVAA